MVGSRPARLVGLSTGLVTLLTLQLINVIFVCFVNQFSNAQILAETSITNTVDLAVSYTHLTLPTILLV